MQTEYRIANDGECSYGFAKELIEDHWNNTHVKEFLPLGRHDRLLREYLCGTDTYDAYLYLDDGTLVGAVIMARLDDHHVGPIAVPLVCYVHSKYRSLYTAMWVIKQERHLTKMLGLWRYQRCKHIDKYTTQFTIKEL